MSLVQRLDPKLPMILKSRAGIWEKNGRLYFCENALKGPSAFQRTEIELFNLLLGPNFHGKMFCWFQVEWEKPIARKSVHAILAAVVGMVGSWPWPRV